MEMERKMPIAIIIPARNEAENLTELIPRIVEVLQENDEIVIIEGGSTDNTYDVATKLHLQYSQVSIVKQTGTGKFNAVLNGVETTNCETVMVWDADATVNFDQNIKIYSAGREDDAAKALILGDRLRGHRERKAMRPINLLGNWAFAILWSPILMRKPIDLLCGSKKFPREVLNKAPNWLLQLDPYGDFTMIIVSKQLGYEITSIPVLYHARTYGHTNIHRWSGGITLLKVSLGIIFRLVRKDFWK